jgi:predicted small metal-binding protein
MYTISCRDVGRDCDCVIQGETEEEIMKNAAEHAVKGHGYKEEDIMRHERENKITYTQILVLVI